MGVITEERPVFRCGSCELNQYVTASNKCRRCGAGICRGSVESAQLKRVAKPGSPKEPVIELRRVMRAAAVHAVDAFGGRTTKAAKALGIPHGRLKQLLREAGDNTDRRYEARTRKA